MSSWFLCNTIDHLFLDFPLGFFPSGFPSVILFTIFLSSILKICHNHFSIYAFFKFYDNWSIYQYFKLIVCPYSPIVILCSQWTVQSSRHFSKNLNIKIYKIIILPVCYKSWNMVHYFQGGKQVKGIWKQNDKVNIWAQEGWKWGVEKTPQWGTS